MLFVATENILEYGRCMKKYKTPLSALGCGYGSDDIQGHVGDRSVVTILKATERLLSSTTYSLHEGGAPFQSSLAYLLCTCQQFGHFCIPHTYRDCICSKKFSFPIKLAYDVSCDCSHNYF